MIVSSPFAQFLRLIRKLAWFMPGFLLWASFPPFAERVDVLFALVPLMWLSRQGDAKRSAWRWAQSGLFYWLATLIWMTAIIKNNGPWPLVVLGWIGLSTYCTLFFAAYGFVAARWWAWANTRQSLSLRLVGVLLVEPILWCGLELLRSRLFGGFAWNQLGVVPVNSGFGSPAALGGVYLCSAVIILINGSIAGIAERVISSIRRQPTDRLRSLETVLAFAAVWLIYATANWWPESNDDRSHSAADKTIRLALVQRNFPCRFQDKEDNPYKVYGRLVENAAVFNPDLVVLPESATCEFGPIDGRSSGAFAQWLSKACGNAAVLMGGTRFDGGRQYNSAALYDFKLPMNAADRMRIYDKVHLVPFGEYIPGDKWITALQEFSPVGSCTPGEPKLLGDYGVAICYEDTDSALMRQYAALGAKALVFITNDSWFSYSAEAVSHSWQAVTRAIETGLPVVRVGNSGVTGTIAPSGICSWLTGPDGHPLVDKSATMFARLALASHRLTPYVRLGDLPLGIIFTLLILTIIMIEYYHERK